MSNVNRDHGLYIKEFLSFEESIEEFEKNMKHYIKSPNFGIFLKSLGEEKIVEIIKTIKSNNDKKAFLDFIEKTKPKYVKKEPDEKNGWIYTYQDKIIWQPQKTNNLEEIEKIIKEKIKETPTKYIVGNKKYKYNNLEDALYEATVNKKKIIFIVEK